jgi:hypothetical protein
MDRGVRTHFIALAVNGKGRKNEANKTHGREIGPKGPISQPVQDVSGVSRKRDALKQSRPRTVSRRTTRGQRLALVPRPIRRVIGETLKQSSQSQANG